MTGTGGVWPDVGAGPYQPEQVSPALPPDPVELLYVLLKRDVNPRICPNVLVGPTTNDQQQAGVCSLTPAGQTMINPHLPLKFARVQVRCIHHQLAQAAMIGEHVYQQLQTRHRQTVTQPSSGNTYLVHRTQVTAGPSTHFNTATTWESLLFVELLVGTQPIS